MTPILAVVVLVAGGIAALIRYLVALLFARHTDPARFPWAVLAVNVVGSALGGGVLGIGMQLPADIRLILLTGVAGALTTFSTFSVETVQLVLIGRARVAALNVAANLVAGIAVAAAAYLLVVG